MSKLKALLPKLNQANLAHAEMIQACLTHADLSGAYLSGANLTHADLSGADLSGANLGVSRIDVLSVVNRVVL